MAMFSKLLGSIAIGAVLCGGQSSLGLAEIAHSPIVLYGWGLDSTKFGSTESGALAKLETLFGRVDGPVPLPNDTRCGVDVDATWPHMQVFFFNGRLVGYNTGYSAKPLNEFETSKGLRVGDTVATARKLYGADLRVSARQGGSWDISGSASIYGYLVGPPRDADDRIAGIAAGHVGCPAVTP
ncbi:MAG: hypothetical protein JWM55_2105 [Acidimicrobiaceae bacterium]|nr:hypothetical protein [Acidimicrobiaceae bacterium]